MRLSCALLVITCCLCGGCSTTTVMGISGGDWVPLGTREQVHDALGSPSKVDIGNGSSFEEFLLRGGCDQMILGCRTPAFQPLEQFHIRGCHGLRLMAANDVGSLPAKGSNLVVVAKIYNVLQFRIFDEEGRIVVDNDETKLASKSRSITDLKSQLDNLWPPHKLNEDEKQRITAGVVSIVGHNPLGSFEVGMGTLKTYGLVQIGTPNESDPNKQRVLPGQILRFEFDHLGNARKVYVDGELILSIIKTDSALDRLLMSASP